MINKQVQRIFSRIGTSFTVFGLVANGVQFLAAAILGVLSVFGVLNYLEILTDANMSILLSMVSMYVIALPILLLMVRKLPKHVPPKHKLTFGRGFRLFLIGMAVMFFGSIIGNGLSYLIGKAFGTTIDNTTIDAVGGMNVLVAFVAVVLIGPLVEELLFRKIIIDRLRVFGEKQVMVLSALMFGLFHTNIYQLFYTFGLGLLLAYIYLRTGRIRYTCLFHMLINFFFGIVPLFLLSEDADINLAEILENGPAAVSFTPQLVLTAVYGWAEILLAFAGFVLFFVYLRRMVFVEQPYEIPKGLTGKTVYGAAGIILFLVCYGIMNIGGVVAQILPQYLF